MRLGGNTRHACVAALIAVGLLAVAGCGGNDEDDATQAAEEALTSTEPSSCEELQTENYRQQIQLSSGEFALKACQQELFATAADSAEVTEITVDGDTATVDVAHTGAAFDGQVLTYEMVKEDGDWKLNELLGFAQFDMKVFARSLDRLAKQNKDINPPGIDCVNDQLTSLSVQELEDLYTSGDFREYSKIYAACQ